MAVIGKTGLVSMASGRSSAWTAGLVSLLGLLLLPWVRTDRSFLEFNPNLLAMSTAPVLGAVLLAVAFSLTALSLFHLPLVHRGYALVVLGSGGFLAGMGWLVATSAPLGLGALVVLVALMFGTRWLAMLFGFAADGGGHWAERVRHYPKRPLCHYQHPAVCAVCAAVHYLSTFYSAARVGGG